MPALADTIAKLKHTLRSQLLVNARHYLVANVISGAIPFLLLPVLTRYLAPEDFGIVALYTALSAVVAALFALGVNGAVSRIYFDLPEEEFLVFVGTCLVLVAACACGLTVVIFLAADLIADLTRFPASWLWAVVLTATAQAVFAIGLAVYQVRGNVRQFAVAQVAQATLLAVLTIALVVGLSFDWRGRIIAQALSTIIVTMGMLDHLVRRGGVPLRLETRYAIQALRYGLPLVIHVLSGITISLVDRFVIARLMNLRETGLYAAAGQVTAALIFVIDAFNRAYAPWLFSALASADMPVRRKVVHGTYVYFVVIWIVAMGFALVFGSMVGTFLGERYVSASRYVWWMSAAAAFMGMYYMVTLYIQFSKRTEYLATITLSVGAINVFLCYVLVSSSGGIGAAYASTIAQALMFVASWIVAAKLVPMPWLSPRSGT